MAKKKANGITKMLPLVAVVLGVISIIMMFLPAIGIKDTEITYSGFQTAFGYTKTDKTILATVSVKYFNFSILLVVGFALSIASVALTLLQMIKPKGNFFALLAVVCFVLATLCWFLQIPFLSVGEGFTVGGIFNPELAKDSMQLAYGAIIGGIASALGAVACALPIFMKK